MAKTPSDTGNNDAQPETVSGKGRATPTRKEREAARKRPIVSSDRAEARKQARAANAALRERARIGMANGEEKYLPLRDRGPQKRFVRDYIDARFSAGELMIPLMIVVIILTFFPPDVQAVGLIALWAFFLLAIVDSIVAGLVVRKKLREKFGASAVQPGVRWYAAMRSLQLRSLRMPKPLVKRGAYPA